MIVNRGLYRSHQYLIDLAGRTPAWERTGQEFDYRSHEKNPLVVPLLLSDMTRAMVTMATQSWVFDRGSGLHGR